MTTTEMLERYLQAVGQYLPEATRQDTIAELRANLQEQMDARAEEAGRPLNTGDMAAMLKEHGKPEAVAVRYLPQRSLIGPAIFPFYVFTLKRVLPLVLGICVIAQVVKLVVHDPGDWTTVAGTFFYKLIAALAWVWAIVTMMFAAIEYARCKGKLTDAFTQWDPMELPAVHASSADDASYSVKSMWKRVIELCVHCLWMGYVLVLPRHPFFILGPGVLYLDKIGVDFAPVWHVFYVMLIVLLTVQLGMKLLALTPGPHAWVKPMEFATNVWGVIALGVVARADQLFVATSGATSLELLAKVNHSVGLAMRIALAVAVVGLINDGWKLMRRMRPARQLAF